MLSPKTSDGILRPIGLAFDDKDQTISDEICYEQMEGQYNHLDEGEQEQVWIQAVTELADGVEIDVDNNELSEFRTFLKNQFFEHCGNEAAYGHESREELYNVFKNW